MREVAQADGYDELDVDAALLAECMLDLGAFGSFCEIPAAGADVEGIIPFGWDAWSPEQQEFELHRSSYDVVLKSRQMGFTTLELARDLQFARTHDAAQVLIVVHDRNEKKKLFSRLKMMADSAHAWGVIPEAFTDTQTSITWRDNRSGIFVVEAGNSEAAAAKKGRSGTVHRLHATEVAFWGQAQTTWVALEGATEHGGEIVVESTANGRVGTGKFFYDMVKSAEAGKLPPYSFHFYPWYARPDRRADPWTARSLEPRTEAEAKIEDKLTTLGCDEEQIAWWRARLRRMQAGASLAEGLASALQEYPPTVDDAFQVDGSFWLGREHISWLQDYEDEGFEEHQIKHRGVTYRDKLHVFERPKRGELYVVSVDPAEGEGEGDEAAVSVMHWRSMRTVATWWSTKTKAGALGHVAAYVGRYYNTAMLGIEIQAKGGGRETMSVVVKTEKYPRPRIFTRKLEGGKKRRGWSTDGKTRPVMFGDMAKLIEDHDIWTPCAKMVSEASTLVPTSRGPRAHNKGKKGGADDGLFVTWAMNVQIRMRMRATSRGGVKGVGSAAMSHFPV